MQGREKRRGGSWEQRLQKAADKAGVLWRWEAWPVSSGHVGSGDRNNQLPVGVGWGEEPPRVLPTGCHPSLCGPELWAVPAARSPHLPEEGVPALAGGLAGAACVAASSQLLLCRTGKRPLQVSGWLQVQSGARFWSS